MRRRMPAGFTVALGAVAATAIGGGCSAYEWAEIEVSQRAPVARAIEGALLIPVPTLNWPVDDGDAGTRLYPAAGSGDATVSRRGSPGRFPRRTLQGRAGAQSARFESPDLRVTLSSSSKTSRAELGLVASALDFVGVNARPRSVVDGLAHFSDNATQPRVVIRIERTGGRGAETWILNRTWALRRMDGGAMLVWEGELGPVLDRLSVVLRGRGGIPK